MASATISITVTDSANVTLADVRDSLCTRWGYTGSPSDNAAKLAFLKTFLSNFLASEYLLQKRVTVVITAQQNQDALSAQISLS